MSPTVGSICASATVSRRAGLVHRHTVCSEPLDPDREAGGGGSAARGRGRRSSAPRRRRSPSSRRRGDARSAPQRRSRPPSRRSTEGPAPGAEPAPARPPTPTARAQRLAAAYPELGGGDRRRAPRPAREADRRRRRPVRRRLPARRRRSRAPTARTSASSGSPTRASPTPRPRRRERVADGDAIPDYVESLLAIAERSYAVEVAPGPLGWAPPKPDPRAAAPIRRCARTST